MATIGKLYLTKEFKDFSSTKGVLPWIRLIPSIWRFLRLVHRSQKTAELFSFIVWELAVRFGVIGQKLKFTAEEPMLLGEGSFSDIPIENGVKAVLHDNTFLISEMPDIGSIYLYGKNRGWGFLRDNPRSLFHWEIENGKLRELGIDSFKGGIQSVFRTSEGSLFVCENGKVHRKTREGNAFEKVLQLTYPHCYFRPHCGMTELPNRTLIIGEYGNQLKNKRWESLANIYISEDSGRTWEKSDFLIEEKTNKHVHIVRYFQSCNCLMLTDGDNKKRLWINDTKRNFARKTGGKNSPDGWRSLTQFHLQMGGHLSAAEFDNKAYLGTDYLGGTNFILNTKDFKHFEKQYLPAPYRRSIVYTMQTAGNSLWALVRPPHFRSCRGLLMLLKKGTKKWKKVIHFDYHRWNVNIISNSIEPVDRVMIGIENKVSKRQRVFQIEVL